MGHWVQRMWDPTHHFAGMGKTFQLTLPRSSLDPRLYLQNFTTFEVFSTFEMKSCSVTSIVTIMCKELLLKHSYFEKKTKPQSKY